MNKFPYPTIENKNKNFEDLLFIKNQAIELNNMFKKGINIKDFANLLNTGWFRKKKLSQKIYINNDSFISSMTDDMFVKNWRSFSHKELIEKAFIYGFEIININTEYEQLSDDSMDIAEEFSNYQLPESPTKVTIRSIASSRNLV